MRVKRKASIAAVDAVENNRSICNNCYSENCTTKLVPYEKDSSMKICPVCKFIVKKTQMRFESTTVPLGSLSGKSPTYEVVEKRRSRSRINRSFEPTEEPIPLLNNKRDTELESLLQEHNGILISCTDENTDMEELEY